jgi:hypothetical protein
MNTTVETTEKEERIRIHLCRTCDETVTTSITKTQHDIAGHVIDVLTLKKRIRRQGKTVAVQWSTDWKVYDRRQAPIG